MGQGSNDELSCYWISRQNVTDNDCDLTFDRKLVVLGSVFHQILPVIQGREKRWCDWHKLC